MANGRHLLALLLLAGCYSAHDISGGDVGLTEKYGVHGLITDPSPAQLKAGALSTAHNVVFRRPNMAEPRPGFEAYVTNLPYDKVRKLIPFDGDVLSVGAFEGETLTHWITDEAASVKDESNAQISWTNPYIRGVVARKNLYLTTSDAVRKVTDAADYVAGRAGMPAPPVIYPVSGGAGSLVAQNNWTAYRATLKRIDANETVVVSRPTGRFLYENPAAATQYVSCKVFFGDGHAAGDIVQLWRSTIVANTVTPSDEMRLVVEHEVTSAEITAGFATLTDQTLDTERGESLYTNPTREGIERSNYEPPRARDLGLFQGSLFAGDIVRPPSLRVAYSPGVTVKDYTTTFTRTNASANVVVASATGLKIGQILIAATTDSWGGTAAVRITAIAGTTITMSQTWTGATDGAPVACTFSDSIRVKSATEDQYYLANHAFYLIASMNAAAFGTVIRTVPSAEVVAESVGDAAFISGSLPDEVGARRTFLISTLLPSHAGFEVFATNGASYEPALPEPTVASGYASVPTAVANGLAWSKTDQPEHFLLSALWYVGRETSPILRIIPTRDSLLIFKGKGDGIYRLTGFGERSGWRVDPVDEDTYLLHPELVLETDGRVYAWTNKGLVQVTDAGVSPPLTTPIATTVARQTQTLDSTATAFYAFSFANVKDGELVFGMPDETPSVNEGVTTAYVYNLGTKSWSTWLDGATHYISGAYNPADGLMLLGKDNSATVFQERDSSDSVINADTVANISITSINTSTNQLTYTGTYTAAVGDLVIAANGQASHVSSTVDSTHCIVMDASAMNTGAATAYAAFTSTLTWQPDTLGSSSVWKHYLEQVTHYDDTYGLSRWAVTFSAGEVLTTATNSYTQTLQRSTHPRGDKRALPPRTVAHARHMIVSVAIACADARWRITGIALGAEPASMRAQR